MIDKQNPHDRSPSHINRWRGRMYDRHHHRNRATAGSAGSESVAG